jgi:hypothetical protein
MADIVVSIAKQFSAYPAGRTRRDGKYSAEAFREDILIPSLQRAIANKDRIVVELDGVYGFSSSFLEETFGGLVRRGVFTPADLKGALAISYSNPIYASVKIDAETYLHDELMNAA